MNMIGRKFGKLTVTKHAGTKNRNSLWECLCDCGDTSYCTKGNLTSGRTKSCGCLKLSANNPRKKQIDMGLAMAMFNSGETLDQIASVCAVSRHTVSKRLRENGVSNRQSVRVYGCGEHNPAWKGGRFVSHKGYVLIHCPMHHRRGRNVYVMEHVLVMEQHLGRNLVYYSLAHGSNEVVHHINGEKSDNRIENLQLMTHSEHMALHGKITGAKRNGRNIVEYKTRIKGMS